MYDLDNPRWAADISWRYALVQLEGITISIQVPQEPSYTAMWSMLSANIFLDENFRAKVAEFGLSETCPYLDQTHVSTTVKGSFAYLDPEYLTRQQLTGPVIFVMWFLRYYVGYQSLIHIFQERKWIDRMCHKVGEESKGSRSWTNFLMAK